MLNTKNLTTLTPRSSKCRVADKDPSLRPRVLLCNFMSMRRDCVSELRPPAGLLFIWWNDTDRGKAKISEKNLPHCHFVRHKPHMDWPGHEPGLCNERPATNRLSHDTAFSLLLCLTLWRRSLSKCYLRIQSVPQREHHTSPLQRSTG